jgi:segregation and condensation protein B
VTWGTTDAFLDHFGLESLADLPGLDELKAAGLLDKRPAIESYAVKGQMRAAGDTEGMDDLDHRTTDLFSEDESPDEPLQADAPDGPDEEIGGSTERQTPETADLTMS